MKPKLLLLFTALIFAFASCKKCYDCELQSYCATCSATASDGTVYPSSEVCGEKEDIDDYEAAYKSQAATAGWTANCKRETELDDVTEVCDKPNKAEARVTILEFDGYTCVEK